MIRLTCKTCWYFRDNGLKPLCCDPPESVPYGECRRYPPQKDYRWVEVAPTDYCGEHSAITDADIPRRRDEE